ncbi:hypothetical protein [Poseidonibacter ostreae]|uniref:Uncharacterized protein n=1 Tax=Poseidonibacter ostreae TaxID=2654171 RepID=A0A6L4WWN8_9BACT|nr:hypothetical protein [Poseidonibacter ostreae]KAB7891358.1 hypothetical protein GBG19_00550 [Poseidonibacter ostreae]
MSKIYLVQLNWFIDGIKGQDEPKRKKGNDCIVIVSSLDEVDNVAESVVESMGQGGTSTSFHSIDIEKDEFDYYPTFVSAYWSCDNVDNYGLLEAVILKEFIKEDLINKNIDKSIAEAIEKQAYYSFH